LPCHEPDLDAPVVVSTGGRTLTCDCGADPGSVICTDDSCAAREYRFDSASTLEAPLDVAGWTLDTTAVDQLRTCAALPDDAWVLDGVTVVDADGARADRAVVLSAEGIVVEAAAGSWPALPAVDGSGRYLVPGLVDAHVHLNYGGAIGTVGDTLATNLAAELYWGVTAVADLGGPEVLFALRDHVAAGDLLAPDIVATGPMLTAVGSHPCEGAPDPDLCVFVTADDAAEEGQRLLDAGADGLKVAIADAGFTDWATPRIDPEAVAGITSLGAPVFAHVDADADVIDAVDAGVSVLAHPPFGGPIGADALAAATSVDAVITTVGAFAGVGDLLDGSLDPDDPDLVLTDAVRDDWRAVQDGDIVLLDGWAEASADWAADARANLAALDAGGARLIPGSDAGYYFVPHGRGLHRELTELEALGWTPLEVLTATTLDARTLLGLPGGRIEAGSPADLVVLTEDPTASVSALASIEAVIRTGVYHPREELRVPQAVAFDDVCLSACPEGRCDGVSHECVPACDTPCDRYEPACGAEAWCMPADGANAAAGVCHVEAGCDLYTQDCSPAWYAEACAPLDSDTNTCIPGGPRTAGQACSWVDPDLACQPGLFCSWIDFTCYTLCDPDAPDCPGGLTCHTQYADTGVEWFGLCL
jgi:imidazolonepropionase-like amidohydrolase